MPEHNHLNRRTSMVESSRPSPRTNSAPLAGSKLFLMPDIRIAAGGRVNRILTESSTPKTQFCPRITKGFRAEEPCYSRR